MHESGPEAAPRRRGTGGLTRRRLLAAGSTVVASVGLAGCLGGGGGGSSDGDESAGGDAGSTSDAPFDGYLSGVTNFDGVVDRTGQSEVRVVVGAEANGGYLGYAPAAVRVSTGTTVVWEWNGKGGAHNVLAEDGSYSSALTTEQGHTFRRTFDEAGTSKYYCRPHRMVNMKGVVVVE
jgi:halocyanin-like protein